ncbi:MAG TPA: sensor histidine kinase [Anaerolineales bacterium]|nr:sensor histidine kinase [Anaerolineales bacterium]
MSRRFPFFRIVNDSLRAKVTLGVILPLVMILGIFTAIEYNRQQKVILSELSSSASRSVRVIENSLRHAMLKSDFSEVQTVLDSINDTEDFRVVYLLNTNGKIIFAPNQVGVGNQLKNTEPGCKPCHRLEPDARPGSVIVTAEDGQQVFRSMYPIRNSPECSNCHDPKQQIIGLLLTDIPVAPVENALEASFRENLFWWVGMILITALIVNFSMNSLVIQRLKGLAQALQGFGQGRHDIRLESGGSDEIGKMGESFNEMSQRIEMEEIENKNLSTQLRNQNIQRGELLKRLITAQEDERKRVARELHDDLGQALSALSLQVQSLERLINSNPDEAVEQLNQISDLIAETTERMYELILALRPSVLDEFGLVAALRNHAERFLDGSGIVFELDASDYSGRLTPEIETALYRVFQEALSNARRHAQAKHVKITLKLKDGVFMGEIQDDGKGFDPRTVERNGDDLRGLGMLSIKERIAQYCGQVEILSRIGRGTTISIRLSTAETNCD